MVASNTPGKFDEFDRMIREAKAQRVTAVLIHHPEVLGDNYTELVTNLNKLADAELMLRIAPTKDRKSGNA
jgi:hypothetical protein